MRLEDDTPADRGGASGAAEPDGVGASGPGSADVTASPVELTDDLRRRILFILHRGFTEARNLAYAGRAEQIADLADALEIIPGMLLKWDAGQWDMLRFVLKTYEDKYPTGRYDYTPYLDRYPVHDWY
jgi:hypothetical protein